MTKLKPRIVVQGMALKKFALNQARTSVDMDGTLKFVNYKVGGTQKTPTALLKPNFFVKVLSFLMLIKS